MTRKEYIDKAKSKLDDLDTTIAKLEARAEAAKGALKQDIQREIEEIRQSKRTAEGALQQVQASTDAAWQDLKVGAELAWRSLSESVESAVQRFK